MWGGVVSSKGYERFSFLKTKFSNSTHSRYFQGGSLGYLEVGFLGALEKTILWVEGEGGGEEDLGIFNYLDKKNIM